MTSKSTFSIRTALLVFVMIGCILTIAIEKYREREAVALSEAVGVSRRLNTVLFLTDILGDPLDAKLPAALDEKEALVYYLNGGKNGKKLSVFQNELLTDVDQDGHQEFKIHDLDRWFSLVDGKLNIWNERTGNRSLEDVLLSLPRESFPKTVAAFLLMCACVLFIVPPKYRSCILLLLIVIAWFCVMALMARLT